MRELSWPTDVFPIQLLSLCKSETRHRSKELHISSVHLLIKRAENIYALTSPTDLDGGTSLLCLQHDGCNLWRVLHLVERKLGDDHTRAVNQLLGATVAIVNEHECAEGGVEGQWACTNERTACWCTQVP